MIPGGDGGDLVTLLLCRDVMPGRGVDQMLPHPRDPELCEPGASNAGVYVRLAERVNGPVPCPVAFDWPWGDALRVAKRQDRAHPDGAGESGLRDGFQAGCLHARQQPRA